MNDSDLALIGNSPAAPLVIFMVAMGEYVAGTDRSHGDFIARFSHLRGGVALPAGPDEKARILQRDFHRIVEGLSNLEDLIEDMESVMYRP